MSNFRIYKDNESLLKQFNLSHPEQVVYHEITSKIKSDLTYEQKAAVLTFVKKNAKIYNKIKNYSLSDKGEHILSNEIRVSSFQKDFRNLMGEIYGEHAKLILEEHPNLTFENMNDFRVLTKNIYDNFGKNFVDQLLNFNFFRVGITGEKSKYHSIMYDIISNDEDMQSFKYCYELVKSKKERIYDLTKLFRTYSLHGELIKDCYLHKNNLSSKQHNTLLDVISINSEMFEKTEELPIPKTAQELEEYSNTYRDFFNTLIKRTKNDVFDVLNIFFERFFGNTYNFRFSDYNEYFNRNLCSVKAINKFYNINKLIQHELNLNEFDENKRSLTDEEISILKILSATEKLVGFITTDREDREAKRIIIKLYEAFDKASERENGVICPRDFMNLFSKIPLVYEEHLRDDLTSVKDLENAVENNEKGIRRSYISKECNGQTLDIPIYHLEGCKFSHLVTSLEANYTINLNLKNENMADFVERIFTMANASTHISASYLSSEVQRSVNIPDDNGENEAKIDVILPKNFELMAMGANDIWTSARARGAEITSNNLTKFYFPFELAIRSMQISGFNEVAIERYSRQGKFSGRIIPEAAIKEGKEPHERVVEYAAQMTMFLRNNGLVPSDYVFPIVMCDLEFYSNKNEEMYINREALNIKTETINKLCDKQTGFEKIKEYLTSIATEAEESCNKTNSEEVESDNSTSDTNKDVILNKSENVDSSSYDNM